MIRRPPRSTLFPYTTSSDLYVGMAKHGCFMPARITQPVVGYKQMSIMAVSPNSTTSAQTIKYMSGANIYGTNKFSDGTSWTGEVVSTGWPSDCDWSTGVILVKGLSPEASLDLTRWTGVELSITDTHPYSPSLTDAIAYDPKAMESASRIRSHMADAYPSSANDLSDIWGFVKKHAPSAWAALKPAVKALLPVVPGGSMIGKVLDVVENPTPQAPQQPKSAKKKKKKRVVSKKS